MRKRSLTLPPGISQGVIDDLDVNLKTLPSIHIAFATLARTLSLSESYEIKSLYRVPFFLPREKHLECFTTPSRR